MHILWRLGEKVLQVVCLPLITGKVWTRVVLKLGGQKTVKIVNVKFFALRIFKYVSFSQFNGLNGCSHLGLVRAHVEGWYWGCVWREEKDACLSIPPPRVGMGG